MRITSLGSCRPVEGFFQGTSEPFTACIAHEGGFLQLFTAGWFIVVTEFHTFTTGPAGAFPVCAAAADQSLFAGMGRADSTVVIRFPIGTSLFKNPTLLNLL